MAVEKFSVSFDPELAAFVRAAADEAGQSVSAYLAEAARERARGLAVDRWIAEQMAEFGWTPEALDLEAAEAMRTSFWTGEAPGEAGAA